MSFVRVDDYDGEWGFVNGREFWCVELDHRIYLVHPSLDDINPDLRQSQDCSVTRNYEVFVIVKELGNKGAALATRVRRSDLILELARLHHENFQRGYNQIGTLDDVPLDL